jgi:hypothetical protein
MRPKRQDWSERLGSGRLAPVFDRFIARAATEHSVENIEEARLNGDRRELDRVAGANRPALDDLRPETRVKQSLQHFLSAEESDEVLAGFTVLFALALDLADAKAAADEVREVNVPDMHLTSRLSGSNCDAMFGLQLFERLRFDQRDVARLGVVEVAVAFQASACVSHSQRHLMRKDAHVPGEKNRFHAPSLLSHLSVDIFGRHPGGLPRLGATVAMTSR